MASRDTEEVEHMKLLQMDVLIEDKIQGWLLGFWIKQLGK